MVKNRAKWRHLHKSHIDTPFARAYQIASEHHVAVPAHEQIVFDQIPDEGLRAEGGSTTHRPDRETQQEKESE